MGFEEVAIICLSTVSCVALGAIAYYLSELKKEQLRQYGITQRAQMKLGTPGETTTSPYGQEWWVPLVTQVMQNPQVMNMLLQKVAPGLTQQITPTGEIHG